MNRSGPTGRFRQAVAACIAIGVPPLAGVVCENSNYLTAKDMGRMRQSPRRPSRGRQVSENGQSAGILTVRRASLHFSNSCTSAVRVARTSLSRNGDNHDWLDPETQICELQILR